MNIFMATNKITEAQVIDIIAQALLKRKEHDVSVSVRIEDEVFVNNGIHTSFSAHHTFVHMYGYGDYTVHFFRYRQHSPCRGRTYHQISEPYGSNEEGIKVRVDNYYITVNY